MYPHRTAASLCVALLSITGTAALAAKPVYRIIDLGVVPGYTKYYPTDLNDNGVIVGQMEGPGLRSVSFIWTREAGISKSEPPYGQPYSNSGFAAINARGKGVLSYRTREHPDSLYFIADKDGGKNFFLDGTWAADRVQYVLQMSNSGYVLGASYFEPPGSYASSPWVWSKQRGLTEILPGYPSHFYPSRMNERGQVVGSYEGDCSERAFIYDLAKGDLTPLGPGVGPGSSDENCSLESRAYAINDRGQVVGRGNSPRDPDNYRVFLWSAADGYEEIPLDDDPTTYSTTPSDISESGQVVGHFAHTDSERESYFYWDRPTGLVDLQSLLDPTDPLSTQIALESYGNTFSGSTLDTFPRVNRRGELIVTGRYLPQDEHERPNRVFLLEPISSNRASSR